jgi:hypothetical protein
MINWIELVKYNENKVFVSIVVMVYMINTYLFLDCAVIIFSLTVKQTMFLHE